jgi:hypothetical protein
MIGFVNSERVLEWQDTEKAWTSGCVGLGVKNGRTMFKSISLRPTS